jgi:O-antigen/teichoic acid export membrane protein
LHTVLFPLIRKSYDDGREVLTRDLLTAALRAILATWIFGTITVCLGAQYLFILMRIPKVTPDTVLVFMLSLAYGANCVRTVLAQILAIEKKTHHLVWICVFGAVASLVLFGIFTGWAHLLFAALGVIVGNAVQAVLMATKVSRNLLPIPSWHFFLAMALAAALALGIQWVARGWGLWPYAVAVLVSGLAYSLVAIQFGALTPEEKMTLIGVVKRRLGLTASVPLRS